MSLFGNDPGQSAEDNMSDALRTGFGCVALIFVAVAALIWLVLR